MRGFDTVEPGVWRDPRSGHIYTSVSYRTRMFREKFPAYGVNFIEVPYAEGNGATQADPRGRFIKLRCEISDETGRLIAVGHAEEDRKFGPVNKTSGFENAETSALGRALACLGFLSDQYASAEEVEQAREAERDMDRYERVERQTKAARGGQGQDNSGGEEKRFVEPAKEERRAKLEVLVGPTDQQASVDEDMPPSQRRIFVDLLAEAQTVRDQAGLEVIMTKIRNAREELTPDQLSQLKPAVLAARAAFGGE